MTRRRKKPVSPSTQSRDDDSRNLTVALTKELVPSSTIPVLLDGSGLTPQVAYDLIRSGIAVDTVLKKKHGSPDPSTPKAPEASEAPEEELGYHEHFLGLTRLATNLFWPLMPFLSPGDRLSVTSWARTYPLSIISHGYSCVQLVQSKGRPIHTLVTLLYSTKMELEELTALVEETPICFEDAIRVVKGGHTKRARRLGENFPQIWPVIEKFLSAPPKDTAAFQTLLDSGFSVTTATYVIHTCPAFLAYAVYFREKVPRETLDLMVSKQLTRAQLLALDSLLLCPAIAEDPHLCVHIVSHRAHCIESVRRLAIRGEITSKTPLEEILKLVVC